MIELDDDEARLLYAVVLEKAQEHFSYANTSEVATRLCKLAARLARPLEISWRSTTALGNPVREGSDAEGKPEFRRCELALIPNGGMPKSECRTNRAQGAVET